jgi:hypothetical protein
MLTSGFSLALLNVRCLDGSLSAIIDITRLKYSSPLSQRSMVANVLWFGCHLCGSYSCQRRTTLWPLQFARPYISCMSTSSLKRMTIHIVVFMMTQYKKSWNFALRTVVVLVKIATTRKQHTRPTPFNWWNWNATSDTDNGINNVFEGQM